MEVSGKLHPCRFAPRETPWFPLDMRLSEPHNRFRLPESTIAHYHKMLFRLLSESFERTGSYEFPIMCSFCALRVRNTRSTVPENAAQGVDIGFTPDRLDSVSAAAKQLS
jgi:hypothetical protein